MIFDDKLDSISNFDWLSIWYKKVSQKKIRSTNRRRLKLEGQTIIFKTNTKEGLLRFYI